MENLLRQNRKLVSLRAVLLAVFSEHAAVCTVVPLYYLKASYIP